MEISGFDFIEQNGRLVGLRDPDSGAVLPVISGGDQWDESGFDFISDPTWGSSSPQDYSGFEWASPVDMSAVNAVDLQPYGPLNPAYTGTADVLGSQYTGGTNLANGFNPNPSAPYDPSQAGGFNTPNYVLNNQGLPMAIDPLTGQITGPLPGFNYGAGGAVGAPGAAGLGGGSANPWLAGGLGAAGGLAGLIGSLASGGVTSRSQPNLSTAQKALSQYGVQSLQGLNPFIQGTSPNQIAQNSLLQQIAAGQIPQSITDLVRSAYGPVMQNLMTDATNAGRQAGFYDAPISSPPGGAIVGPGLAQLQGQMAGSVLDQMTKLPGLYNQPINNQIGAAQNQAAGYNTAFGNYPYGQTNSQPIGASVGQGLANVASGAAQGYAGQQAQQQQQNTNNLLMAMAMRNSGQGTASLSGTY